VSRTSLHLFIIKNLIQFPVVIIIIGNIMAMK